MIFKNTKEGVSISLHVLPNAPRSEIVGIHNEKLKLKIKAPPVDGKANEAIIEFFSEILKIKKSNIEIGRGGKSKSKEVLIRGIPVEELENLLLRNKNS